MKALTIIQPWASLIALGAKKIETRSWYTDYRGPLAIHASKNFPKKNRDLLFDEPFWTTFKARTIPNSSETLLPTGVIIAVCWLVDCLKIGFKYFHNGRIYVELSDKSQVEGNELAFGDYTPDRYAWILEDVRMLPKPISVKGRLGLWDWEPPEGVL